MILRRLAAVILSSRTIRGRFVYLLSYKDFLFDEMKWRGRLCLNAGYSAGTVSLQVFVYSLQTAPSLSHRRPVSTTKVAGVRKIYNDDCLSDSNICSCRLREYGVRTDWREGSGKTEDMCPAGRMDSEKGRVQALGKEEMA